MRSIEENCGTCRLWGEKTDETESGPIAKTGKDCGEVCTFYYTIITRPCRENSSYVRRKSDDWCGRWEKRWPKESEKKPK